MASTNAGKSILVSGFALWVLSCSSPVSPLKDSDRAFPNGRYTCTSIYDEIVIVKEGPSFSANYTGDPLESDAYQKGPYSFREYQLEGKEIFIHDSFLFDPELIMKGKMTGISDMGDTVYQTPADSVDKESFPIKSDEKGNFRLRKFRNVGFLEYDGYWLYCKKSS